MQLKKNIVHGKNNILLVLNFYLLFIFQTNLSSNDILTEKFVEIKILDKVNSKNSTLVLKVGVEQNFKNLSIKALKCKNSEFDDNPDITAYLQVKDNNIVNKDKVFVFNGWTFSSSPSLRPFDHPIYDIWLKKCFN